MNYFNTIPYIDSTLNFFRQKQLLTELKLRF